MPSKTGGGQTTYEHIQDVITTHLKSHPEVTDLMVRSEQEGVSVSPDVPDYRFKSHRFGDRAVDLYLHTSTISKPGYVVRDFLMSFESGHQPFFAVANDRVDALTNLLFNPPLASDRDSDYLYLFSGGDTLSDGDEYALAPQSALNDRGVRGWRKDVETGRYEYYGDGSLVTFAGSEMEFKYSYRYDRGDNQYYLSTPDGDSLPATKEEVDEYVPIRAPVAPFNDHDEEDIRDALDTIQYLTFDPSDLSTLYIQTPPQRDVFSTLND